MTEINSKHIGLLKIVREYPGITPTKTQRIYSPVTMKTVLRWFKELVELGLVAVVDIGNRTDYYITARGEEEIAEWERRVKELARQ